MNKKMGFFFRIALKLKHIQAIYKYSGKIEFEA